MTRSSIDEATEHTGRLFLEAIRLDMEEVDAARERAREALGHDVGGFIVFGGTTADVRRLTGELRREADRPLWFAADLERGAGQQFRGAATLPPPAGLAAHPDPESAVREGARITAGEAREAGINWVFAPVLDLDVEPENPIVGTRSFGADPETVARLGTIWIEACQDAGVAACGKHFPGHGRTTRDSHLEFPVVDASRAALEADLAPFRRAADTVASLMTAHVGYPALGAAGPATLEASVLRELLRDELGYDGLVVSDALVMEGFGAGGGTATEGWLTVRALRAGCDLLLYPNDLPRSRRTVMQAAEQDARLRERVADALARSARMLERFEAPRADGGGAETEGSAETADVAGRADELAVRCVRARGEGPEDTLDRGRPVRLHVLSDDAGGFRAGGFGDVFADDLRGRGWTVVRAAPEARSAATGDAGSAGGGDAGGGDTGALGGGGEGAAPDGGARDGEQDVILLEATPRAWKGRASLSDACVSEVRRVVAGDRASYLVLFGHPRLLEQLDADGGCAWASEAVMERAAARWLDERVG